MGRARPGGVEGGGAPDGTTRCRSREWGGRKGNDEGRERKREVKG